MSKSLILLFLVLSLPRAETNHHWNISGNSNSIGAQIFVEWIFIHKHISTHLKLCIIYNICSFILYLYIYIKHICSGIFVYFQLCISGIILELCNNFFKLLFSFNIKCHIKYSLNILMCICLIHFTFSYQFFGLCLCYTYVQ